MRRHEFFFWLIRLPLELTIVIVAFLLARHIRVTTDLIPGISLPSRTLDINYLLGLSVVSYMIIGVIFFISKTLHNRKSYGYHWRGFTIIKSVLWVFCDDWTPLFDEWFSLWNYFNSPRLILIYAFFCYVRDYKAERILIRYARIYAFLHVGGSWRKKYSSS